MNERSVPIVRGIGDFGLLFKIFKRFRFGNGFFFKRHIRIGVVFIFFGKKIFFARLFRCETEFPQGRLSRSPAGKRAYDTVGSQTDRKIFD